MAALDQNRFRAVLESLRLADPHVESVVVYSEFVVVYFLQQDGANSGWLKANVSGAVYIVRRRKMPYFQLIVKNKDEAGLQAGVGDVTDFLHSDWELDCQKNYVFYKVEDPSKRIRCLWFHDDAEREKVEEQLNRILEEIRNPPVVNISPPMPRVAAPINVMPQAQMAAMAATAMGASMTQPPRPKSQAAAGQPQVTITMSSLRAAWHALADDEDFMRSVMQKLRSAQQ